MGDNDYSQCYDFGGGSSSKGVFNSTRNCEIIEDINANNNPHQEQVIEYNKIIGSNLYMEFQGVKVLGTVISYEPSLNLFKVRYKDDYPEEHIGLGVILDYMVQQIPEPSNISEKSGESKMLEGEQEKDASIGRNICKDFEDLRIKMDGNDNDKYFVNGVEVGSSLAGVVNKITVETCGEKEDANRVLPSDNTEKDKSVPQLRKIIGCDIYKEFKGVKVLGTVINFMPSANLFEVLYKNDNRMEYLTLDEIFQNMANKEDIWRVQKVSALPPSNTTYMTTETQMKKVVVAGETSTSKRRKGNFSIDAYSSRVGMDIEQPEVTPPEKDMNKEKSNSAQTYTKTEGKIEVKPWYSKKENATKTEPYEPYQFVGLFICKEHNGVRCLGTIQGYNPEMNNKLRVEYKVDGRIEYLTQIEALYAMAKSEDFSTVQRTPNARNGSKKKTGKKKADIGEGSTSSKNK